MTTESTRKQLFDRGSGDPARHQGSWPHLSEPFPAEVKPSELALLPGGDNSQRALPAPLIGI